jgi:hypothetical protein
MKYFFESLGRAMVPVCNASQTIDHLRTIEIKEIKQENARPYCSYSKRLGRGLREVFRVLGDDDFASPYDRSCKDMPILGVAGQTLFESRRDIDQGFREGVS